MSHQQRRNIRRILGPDWEMAVYGSVMELASTTRIEPTQSLSVPTVPDTTQEKVNLERVHGEREVRMTGEGKVENKEKEHEREEKRQEEKQTSWW
jgi:hypothetical protein